MTVKELFDKYCKIEDGEYIVHGQCVTLEPATEEELAGNNRSKPAKLRIFEKA